jgi:hypothetical protein
VLFLETMTDTPAARVDLDVLLALAQQGDATVRQLREGVSSANADEDEARLGSLQEFINLRER